MDWEPAGGEQQTGSATSTGSSKLPPKRKKWPVIVAVLVVLVALGSVSSCMRGCGKSTPTETKTVSTFTWPSSGLATELPKPSTNKGEINSNSDTYFNAQLDGISRSDYDKYIEELKKADYTNFSGEGTDHFSATSPNESSLSLTFDEEEKTLSITLNAKKEAAEESAGESSDTTDTSSDAAAQPASEASTDANGVSADFKATMDGYEQFMNSYVEFMKKYQSSDDTASMLVDYGKMMTQYAEWSSKYDAIDESALSPADDAYYLEVQGRVLQKLAEVQ